jgi:hypothetical protein
VRQHWRGIFDRVRAHHDPRDDESVVRGPEKRRHVLDFLRVNLHEIRPRP